MTEYITSYLFSAAKNKIFNIGEFKDFLFPNKREMEGNEDVISKLKFLGKVQKGEKINVKQMYVQPEGLATRLVRSFINVDSRGNMLSFVKTTITRAFQIVYSYLSHNTTSSRTMCTNIIEDIENSKQGIKNLQFTYSSDIMLCCQMDTILQEIDSKLLEVREKHPEIFKRLSVTESKESKETTD